MSDAITTPEALDIDAIRARDQSFRRAIDASSDRVGVCAIKSARDVSDLLDALTASAAEVERLRASIGSLRDAAEMGAVAPDELVDRLNYLLAGREVE